MSHQEAETASASSAKSLRLVINPPVVARAVAAAKRGDVTILDYVDEVVRGLVLRVRGGSASWLVKTRAHTKKIGEPPGMGVRPARRTAQRVLDELRRLPAPQPAPPPPPGWDWAKLASEYQGYIASPKLKNGVLRAPSKNSIDDARLALGRAQIADWSDRRLSDLGVDDLDRAAASVREKISYPQAKKVVAYVKAAFKWAVRNKRRECGLQTVPAGLAEYVLPEPTGEEIELILERRRPTANADFTVAELGRVLARHEDYCRGRIGRRKVSPAVRWGLWWDALTVCRRGAATLLEHEHIVWSDAHVENGWGLVWWPADVIKGRREFWLPAPPLGLHILNCVRRDWRQAVSKEHGAGHISKWAFPSTRRCGRDPDNRDVVMHSDALANHLAAMRGQRQSGHRDHLADIPPFSLHTIRATASTFLLNEPTLPPGAASAFLGHVLPGDNDPGIVSISRTTDRFYNLAQRIPLKILAMQSWSAALLKAYSDAGGTYPD